MSARRRSAAPAFDYSLDFEHIDFRASPERYVIGRGEQGVLLVEPYKSELLPLWRFRTPEIAETSANALFHRFEAYLADDDFVGADMARKFLQMGFTRARRYANHKSGRKWSPDKRTELPDDVDHVKARSAQIFYAQYRRALDDPTYRRLRDRHINRTSHSRDVDSADGR